MSWIVLSALLVSGHVLIWVPIERDKWRFDCNKQNVKSSGSSPQSRAKGSKERITERDDKKD